MGKLATMKQAGGRKKMTPVELALTQEDEETRKELSELLRDPSFSASQIAEALTDMGYHCPREAVIYARAKMRSGNLKNYIE